MAVLGRRFRFEVPGKPIPQGSKHHVGNGIMVENQVDLGAWRDSIAVIARSAKAASGGSRGGPFGACQLMVHFRLARPKTVTRAMPSVPPDLDKLLRAVFDGLTASGTIEDDARICAVQATKTYALTENAYPNEPGVTVLVEEYEPEEES